MGPQKQADSPEPQRPSLPDVCRQYEVRFGTDYQTVKPNDWKPHDGADRATYLTAREAHQGYKRQQEEYPRLHEAWEQRPKVQTTIIPKANLTHLAETAETQVTPVLMEETR